VWNYDVKVFTLDKQSCAQSNGQQELQLQLPGTKENSNYGKALNLVLEKRDGATTGHKPTKYRIKPKN
jgi:hypothetical protein